MVSRVFVDFGRNGVYALPEDGGEVVFFNDFLDMYVWEVEAGGCGC